MFLYFIDLFFSLFNLHICLSNIINWPALRVKCCSQYIPLHINEKLDAYVFFFLMVLKKRTIAHELRSLSANSVCGFRNNHHVTFCMQVLFIKFRDLAHALHSPFIHNCVIRRERNNGITLKVVVINRYFFLKKCGSPNFNHTFDKK